jgi:hypothetical protein
MFVSCTVFVLSGRGLCDGPIPQPECDQVKIKTLKTYGEQVGRRGKDYETVIPQSLQLQAQVILASLR